MHNVTESFAHYTTKNRGKHILNYRKLMQKRKNAIIINIWDTKTLISHGLKFNTKPLSEVLTYFST